MPTTLLVINTFNKTKSGVKFHFFPDNKPIKMHVMPPYTRFHFLAWDAEEKHIMVSTLKIINQCGSQDQHPQNNDAHSIKCYDIYVAQIIRAYIFRRYRALSVAVY